MIVLNKDQLIIVPTDGSVFTEADLVERPLGLGPLIGYSGAIPKWILAPMSETPSEAIRDAGVQVPRRSRSSRESNRGLLGIRSSRA